MLWVELLSMTYAYLVLTQTHKLLIECASSEYYYTWCIDFSRCFPWEYHSVELKRHNLILSGVQGTTTWPAHVSVVRRTRDGLETNLIPSRDRPVSSSGNTNAIGCKLALAGSRITGVLTC